MVIIGNIFAVNCYDGTIHKKMVFAGIYMDLGISIIGK